MRRPALFHLSLAFLLAFAATLARAQNSSGTVTGTVTDPTGAVVPGASVEISNHVSGYKRTATSDSTGQFRFYNVPFNPYRVTATMHGFGDATNSIDVKNLVPIVLPIKLGMVEASTTINVETGSDLIENDSTFHTDVDRSTIDRMPIESQSSSLSSIVTLSSPPMTSIDCTASEGSWLEKTLLCWSVMGWPSTEKEFSA